MSEHGIWRIFLTRTELWRSVNLEIRMPESCVEIREQELKACASNLEKQWRCKVFVFANALLLLLSLADRQIRMAGLLDPKAC